MLLVIRSLVNQLDCNLFNQLTLIIFYFSFTQIDCILMKAGHPRK